MKKIYAFRIRDMEHFKSLYVLCKNEEVFLDTQAEFDLMDGPAYKNFVMEEVKFGKKAEFLSYAYVTFICDYTDFIDAMETFHSELYDW